MQRKLKKKIRLTAENKRNAGVIAEFSAKTLVTPFSAVSFYCITPFQIRNNKRIPTTIL